MPIKDIMKQIVNNILRDSSYDELSESENNTVVLFETALFKPRIDELRNAMSPEELQAVIHDWWSDYAIADGTEDNLSAYV